MSGHDYAARSPSRVHCPARWSARELARRLDTDDGAVRQMVRGKRPIGAELAAWLERIAATWSTLPPELQEAGRLMGCDRGRFVRRPVNFRPLSDAEAAQRGRWRHSTCKRHYRTAGTADARTA